MANRVQPPLRVPLTEVAADQKPRPSCGRGACAGMRCGRGWGLLDNYLSVRNLWVQGVALRRECQPS